MRGVWVTRTGGPDVLAVRETPDPEVLDGQVRIRVHAAGLNFSDVMARQGLYPDAPKPPCILGYEAAGVVEAAGAGVQAIPIGSRVIAMSRFGAQADTLVVPAAQIILMPGRMTFEEGAAIGVNYITAYHMLFRIGGLRPGEKVLVHMAAGGVGIAALQLCRTVPHVTTFGTASSSKHDAIRAEGCDHPIDYRTADYVEEIRNLTSGKGVDIVLDALGGKDWKKGYDLLRPAGRLIAFGFANMASGEKRSVFHVARQAISVPLFTPWSLMDKNRTISGVHIGHLWNELDMLREEADALMPLYEKGQIRPHVSHTFPFDRAAEAHRVIQERKNIGKVVLIPS